MSTPPKPIYHSKALDVNCWFPVLNVCFGFTFVIYFFSKGGGPPHSPWVPAGTRRRRVLCHRMRHRWNHLEEICSEMQFLMTFSPLSWFFLPISWFHRFVQNWPKTGKLCKKITKYCIFERISTRRFQWCIVWCLTAPLHQVSGPSSSESGGPPPFEKK